MEEERPSKIRKLSHSAGSQNPISSTKPNPSNPPPSDTTEAPAAPAVTEQPPHASSNSMAPECLPSSDDHRPPTAPSEPGADKLISKNQLKKLRRHEQWESQREARKVKRRLDRARRVERKREERAAAAAAAAPDASAPGPAPDRRGRPILLPVTILLDCSFEALMMDSELKSLGSQLTRCYSDNRQAKYRACLGVTSWGGQLKERFEGILASQYKGWKGVRFCADPVEEVAARTGEWMKAGVLEGALKRFAPAKAEKGAAEEGSQEGHGEKKGEVPEIQQGEVIYLSSESDETLTELKPFGTYIIGGLVDRNRHKGICYKTAVEKGIRTARLPIGDYLQMSSRKVLTTNHVNEIMLRWLETGDWGDAFLKVIPQRKGAALRQDGEDEGEDEGAESKKNAGDGRADEDAEQREPEPQAQAVEARP